MKVVVIGGVAAGMSAASKLKRNLKDTVDIIVFEKGGEVSYGACGIPFFVGDRIRESRELVVRTAKEFQDSGINVKTYHWVKQVDTKNKTVYVLDIKTYEQFEQHYDKLIIASGGAVKRFYPFDEKYTNLFEVRNLIDGEQIKTALQKESNMNVLIVGGGYIGLEMAEACKKHGKRVLVVELKDRILTAMDKEASDALTAELVRNGVEVRTSCKVSQLIANNNEITHAVLENEKQTETVEAHIVINCSGINPQTDFIEEIEKANNGAIVVDENMQTSVADIFASGDCSIMKSFVSGQLLYAPFGTNANKQGRIIADVIAGKEKAPFKLIGSSALKLFEVDAAKVGLSEDEAKALGLDYSVNVVTGNSCAHYYGKERLTVKLVYEKNSRKILGAQLFGAGVVAHRANYFAIAISAGMTVEQFGFMDLCYSPPFSPVWDISLIAANTAK